MNSFISSHRAALMACAAAVFWSGQTDANAQSVALEGIVVDAASPVGEIEISPAEAEYGTLIVVDEAFMPVTVVTGRDVLAAQGATVADALDQRPGISGSNFAAGARRPIIRGLDNTRVRVQEERHRLA